MDELIGAICEVFTSWGPALAAGFQCILPVEGARPAGCTPV